jgi:nucleoside 2-deoxyribosyltransferase
MKCKNKIALIGEVCIDYTLTGQGSLNKLRFGGIVHPLRALWALDEASCFFYLCPEYFISDLEKYASEFGAKVIKKIGSITGSPNIISITEPKEIGNQGYDFLLKDAHKSSFEDSQLNDAILNSDIEDILLITSDYSICPIINICKDSKANLHIDLGNYSGDIEPFQNYGRRFKTIFLSTSSNWFINRYDCSIDDAKKELLQYSEVLIFKENRGGGRLFLNENDKPEKYGAQIRPIVHSVGVGDCFDVVYIAKKKFYSNPISLTYASWIAAEYASTTFPDDFKMGVKRVLSIKPETIINISGTSLPWEDRNSNSIYIAAPDFDYKDKNIIDEVHEKLLYHNFKPRLPIRENGQMGVNASIIRKEDLFNKDMSLLHDCNLLLAILIDDDPGTYIEIGYAKAIGKSVIVFDPYNIAENLMLTQMPDYISSNLDMVISKVFELLSKEVS